MNKPVHLQGLSPNESTADVLLCRKDVIRLLGISSTQLDASKNLWRLGG